MTELKHTVVTKEFAGVKVTLREGSSDEIVAEDNLVRRSYEKHGVTLEAPWLDIGGYIGTFALAALRSGGDALVFEPWKPSADLARKNLNQNGYKKVPLERLAVMQEVPEGGTIPLVVNTYRGNYAANSVARRWKRDRPEVAVPVISFADAIAQATQRYPGRQFSVKMDIEGAEQPILDGWMHDYPVDQLVFEYHFAVDSDCGRAQARLQRLRDVGFEVHAPKFPASGEWPGLRIKTMQVWCTR